MKYAIATLTFLMMAATGCAQHAMTLNAVDLTVIPPSKATSTYVYVFSRVTVTGTTCPVPSTGTYAMLNDSAATASPTYTDPAAGLKVCYVAQSKDTSVSPAAYSAPSNVVGPLTVPSDPLAPSLSAIPAVNSAEMVKPIPAPAMIPAKAVDKGLPSPVLTAEMVGLRAR